MYALGRTQSLMVFEVLSQNLVLTALVLLFLGRPRCASSGSRCSSCCSWCRCPARWWPSVTGPLKAAVSAVAARLLYALGYPVARSGVMLSVGQYQLLVADACAGLNSMFTLEALGLLYMNLMKLHLGGAQRAAGAS